MISLRLPSAVVKEKRKGEEGRDEKEKVDGGETHLLLIGMTLETRRHRYCRFIEFADIETTSVGPSTK
jgi:hypothetical protein